MSPSHHVEQPLATEPASVRAARRAVSEAMGPNAGGRELDDVLLATSEVVSNALEHGGPPVELSIDCDGDTVRVEVRDGSPLPPRPCDGVPEPSTVRGRGMLIVDRCSDRWGFEARADGKAVWFERHVR